MPSGRHNPVSKADVALGKIRKLYAIEEEIKELTAQEKQFRQQQESKPLLDDLHQWLEKNAPRLMPDSLIHKAMSYALNQWPKLIVYCADGHLNISNAAAENASAKANGLEPFEYLRHILKELPYADTIEKLEQLLPWAVKASKE